MTTTLTVTPDPDHAPPRVRIDVADTASPPAASVTIRRTNPSGRTNSVRTADGGPLPLSAGQATIYDYEPPYSAPITYSTDVTGGPTATTELDVDDVWLIHIGVPSKSLLLHVTSLPQRTRATSRGLHQVLGRPDPVPISTGTRGAAAATLGVRTFTDTDRAALDAILDDDTVLLLNIPPTKPWGWDRCYVSVGDATEARTTTYGRFPYREWQLPIQVVTRPDGGTQGAITWNDIAAKYPTWDAIKAAGVTSWAQLASPTT